MENFLHHQQKSIPALLLWAFLYMVDVTLVWLGMERLELEYFRYVTEGIVMAGGLVLWFAQVAINNKIHDLFR